MSNIEKKQKAVRAGQESKAIAPLVKQKSFNTQKQGLRKMRTIKASSTVKSHFDNHFKNLTFPTSKDRWDPVLKQKLRQKFIETVQKYYGVPYKQGCYTESQNEYYYPLFVDCWGLIRRATYDLFNELGFQLGVWNQGYQVDTLPIKLTKEEMQPGDLIFYSGT